MQETVGPERLWTFMVYIAGDNNLEAYGRTDLDEMKIVGSTPEVAIVAQFDRMQDGETRRYYLRRATPLEDDQIRGLGLGETNSGDPRELARFLQWAISTYPAQHYALILWNHGTGWKEDSPYESQARPNRGRPGLRAKDNRALAPVAQRQSRPVLFAPTIEAIVARGIAYDDTSSDFLDNAELTWALDAGLTFSGRETLDLLGFDACLMSMIEVAYQVRRQTRVMVGSQETEPGEGWPYERVLAALSASPTQGPKELGRTIVSCYALSYDASDPLTQSALDLGNLDEITASINALADHVMSHLDECQHVIGYATRHAQRFTDSDYVDLFDLCRILAERSPHLPSLQELARTIQAILAPPRSDGFVLAESHQGLRMRDAHGVSIYFPKYELSPFYKRLAMSSECLWDDMLQALAHG